MPTPSSDSRSVPTTATCCCHGLWTGPSSSSTSDKASADTWSTDSRCSMVASAQQAIISRERYSLILPRASSPQKPPRSKPESHRSLTLWDLRQLPPKKPFDKPAAANRLGAAALSICEKRCVFDAHSHLSSVVKQLEREVLFARLEDGRLQGILSAIDDIDRSLLADKDCGPPGVASLHSTASTLVACHNSGR